MKYGDCDPTLKPWTLCEPRKDEAMKDYLTYENKRNRKNADLYEDMLRRAFGKVDTLIAHHLSYENEADGTHGEVPSADTLIFDHEIMTRVFGNRAVPIMRELASVPVEQRDEMLAGFLSEVKKPVGFMSWSEQL